MTKYTIKKGQQDEDVLNINGVQSICPFVQALPMQGQYGNIQIMRLPCNSQCPHAKIVEDNYYITCGNSTISFQLEEAEENVKQTLPFIVV
ncbi:MAG: hypothetical protein ACOVNU_09840 [Candidatus Kapaibacteriota bacterium]